MRGIGDITKSRLADDKKKSYRRTGLRTTNKCLSQAAATTIFAQISYQPSRSKLHVLELSGDGCFAGVGPAIRFPEVVLVQCNLLSRF